MGWAVVVGPVAVSTLTQAQARGDRRHDQPAFRLSGIAGRDGLPAGAVTDGYRQALADTYTYDGPVTLQVKGRSASVDVYGIAE